MNSASKRRTSVKPRSFAGLLAGALAYVSLSALAAIAAEPAPRARNARDGRWRLPVKRLRRKVAEDACRHCGGNGRCDACTPETCRVCRGTGLQPRDASLVPRLIELWDGAER